MQNVILSGTNGAVTSIGFLSVRGRDGIEQGVGDKTGKSHYQTINDTDGRIDRCDCRGAVTLIGFRVEW